MSTSSSISQTVYSPSEPETPQSRLQTFEQSLNHTDLGHSIEQSMKSAQKEQHQKRIQALRKELDFLKSTEWEFEHDKGLFCSIADSMFAYLSSFFNYLTGKDKEDDDSDQEHFLAEQLLDLEINNDDESTQCKEEEELVENNAACFQRTGIITYVSNEYVLIDGIHYFGLTNCPLNVRINDRVCFLGYKKDEDTVKVVRLLENLGVAWGDTDTEENKFDIIEHVLVAEVGQRQERLVKMKGQDLQFSLDEVEGTFVPMEGDWLELICTIQWDTEKPSEITPQKVIEVTSFKALRKRAKSSTVTYWDSQTGVCDHKVFFTAQALQNGTDIKVGCKVLVEAIESNQGPCTWRAIKVILDDTSSLVAPPIVEKDNDEEISLQIEHDMNIQMTYPLKFENISFQKSDSLVLDVKNNSNQTHTLNKWIVLGKRHDSQVLIKPFLTQPVRIAPSQSFQLTIDCKPKFLGNSKETIIIMFKGFKLKRIIDINIVHDLINGSQSNQIENQRNYMDLIDGMKNVRKNANKNIVPGVRPIKPPNFIPVRLGSFEIPEKVWSAVLGDSEQTIYSNEFTKIVQRIEEKLPCLTSDLNITNYTDKWHTLLYMEEIQQNVSMRYYDTPKTFLDRHQEYLTIEIKGLAEKRPSLIQGDKVIAKDIWDPSSTQYEGFVHSLKGNLVLLKFHPRFHETYSGSDVSLEFHLGRSVYRRCHQAVNLALSNLGSDLLFPSKVQLRKPQVPPENIKSISWFNKTLNPGQKTAVTNILLGECRPMPYCIYGPPGTGKTITVIETILQIIKLLPHSRILVATPSNSAANLVTERLLQYRYAFSESITRLIAHHLLESDTIPDVIKPYCATLDLAREDTAKDRYKLNKSGINLNCCASFVGRHRVTIGTCCGLGTLAMMGLPKGHFTHVIIDEAGQATEPEIMIPMTFTDKDSGQIVLAGDPMQLGPVVMSKYCIEFGMDESYLSRILERFPYQKDFHSYKEGYDPRLVTKLNDNYRSLEEVLTLPSQMFYDGSLTPKIDRSAEWINKALNVVSDIFPMEEKKKTGGIFVYGIRGVNARAEDSPSWYNPQEASMVALTVCKLYKRDVTPDDIGVITPYIAQTKYLRLVFEAMGLAQPKIGTVEEFQGQERPIILISTVRSTESYLQDDQKHTLGFVKHPKRLNVALTRAQVAVLLFCNPHLLCLDPLWRKVIHYAVKEDKYTGCDLPFELCNNESDSTNR